VSPFGGWRQRVAGLAAVAAVAAGPSPVVIAHRGASAEAPEHTRAAYDRAVRQGADVMECDLQLTRDEVLVCVHDTTVDRTASGTGTGRVDAHSLAELRRMDFGSWFDPEFAGERVVTFDEQLRRYGTRPGRFYAETKAPAEYGGRMEPALVDLLREHDLVPEGKADAARAPVIVQSFDLESLRAVKRLAPSLPTAWLFVAPPPELATGIPDEVDVLAPAADWVRGHPELVEQAHAADREVHVWTVDDPAEMDALLDLGVDGIFSNTPATLRARVDARAEEEPGTAPDGSDDVQTPTDRKVAADTEPEEDGSSAWVLVVAGGVVLVVIGTGWWLVRRRKAPTV
jgi:glycerophosphoryl diester phosphodiesterase